MRSGDPNVLAGIPASPGVAIGNVFQFCGKEIAVVETGGNREEEESALALATARQELDNLQRELRERASVDKAAIFAAHRELMDDPELLEAARQGLALGRNAASAWKTAFTVQADLLGGMDNEILAGRAADVRDVGLRVLRLLTGTPDRIQQPKVCYVEPVSP